MRIENWVGIGDKQVPTEIKDLQMEIAKRLSKINAKLRTDGAIGSSINFQKGTCEINSKLCEVILPWEGFNSKQVEPQFKGTNYIIIDDFMYNMAAEILTKTTFPWFKELKDVVKKFHVRNFYTLFICGLNQVDAVIYYAEENEKGIVKRDPASIVRLARSEGIPTFNIGIDEQRLKLLNLIEMLEQKALATT